MFERAVTRGLGKQIDNVLLVGGVALAVLTALLGWDWRASVAVAAVVLLFAANVPYVINAVRGRTSPHVVTWLLLGVITTLAFVKQVQEGAEFWTATPLLLTGLMNFVNSYVGRKQASYTVLPTDLACGAAAVVAIIVWMVADSPLVVTVALTAASLLAFVPTIRKAHHAPESETFRTYPRNTIRYALVTLAVSPVSLVTVLYPATWVLVNGFFTVHLVVRRRQLKGGMGRT